MAITAVTPKCSVVFLDWICSLSCFWVFIVTLSLEMFIVPLDTLVELSNFILFLKIALLGQGLVHLLTESFSLRFLHCTGSPVLSDPRLHEL